MTATVIETRPHRAQHWIGGERVDGGRTQPILDPATGEAIGTVPLADRETVDRAVRTASAAQQAWAETPLPRRSAVFQQFTVLLREHANELAEIIVREAGKTLADAEGEIARAQEAIDVACAAPQILKGEYSDQVARNVDTYTLREPNGVMVGITPFNFPLMIPLHMAAPAIVSGNSFVLKPADLDPSAANLVAELFAEVGLPAGVFTVVHGDREASEALIDHPGVAAVSFVGSTPVARAVYQRASAAGKRVQALGGANNHMVVLPDADLDAAADALVASAFGAAGQRCMAVRIAVAVGGDEETQALVDSVAKRAEALRVGPGDDPQSEVGPLISEAARDRMLAQLESGIENGAALVVDGRAAATGEGFFIGPCVATGVEPESDFYLEEVFGPLLVIIKAADLEEAIDIVGQSPYGNGAVIFTRDGGAARRFVRSVGSGNVGINLPIPVPVAWHGFGGWGESRFGDHGLNADAYRFCTRPKTVTARWEAPARESLNFHAR